MSEYVPERMSGRMSEKICAIYTSRWYVRNYVRIVCQGGDHSKKAFHIFCPYGVCLKTYASYILDTASIPKPVDFALRTL